MIQIDGAQGEGGGQVLRTSLALSAITGQAFRIFNIRANRPKPGLRPQHLKAVEAVKAVCNAGVSDAEIGSDSLLFEPEGIKAGNFRIDIGTAGSTSLVLQTLCYPLSFADKKSSVTITGGTHVPWSPSFEYLQSHWLPYLQQIGFSMQLDLELAGFYPRGGGRVRAVIQPHGEPLSPLVLTERGPLKQVRGVSAVANLDRRIAERQRSQVLRRLGARYPLNDLRIVQWDSRFKGTMLLLLAEFESSRCCYFSLGELGKPAERVADEAIDALEAFLDTGGAIDQYLADQLLLPLSFASDPSKLKTSRITNHLATNASIIQSFLPAKISILGDIGQPGMVTIDPM